MKWDGVEHSRGFPHTAFRPQDVEAIIRTFESEAALPVDRTSLAISTEAGRWSFEELDDWLEEYRRSYPTAASLTVECRSRKSGEFARSRHAIQLFCSYGPYTGWETSVTVTAPERGFIRKIFGYVEEHLEAGHQDPPPEPEAPPPPAVRIFVGHGRSGQWRDLKDHLADQHRLDVVAYETGARAGHTIRDVLDSLLSRSTVALLVLTGEDETGDGNLRARQNVVHEVGLFQGRLGWDRAIVLVEEGVESFSNLQGINVIQFGKGNIRETFGDVLATIRREFPAAL